MVDNIAGGPISHRSYASASLGLCRSGTSARPYRSSPSSWQTSGSQGIIREDIPTSQTARRHANARVSAVEARFFHEPSLGTITKKKKKKKKAKKAKNNSKKTKIKGSRKEVKECNGRGNCVKQAVTRKTTDLLVRSLRDRCFSGWTNGIIFAR